MRKYLIGSWPNACDAHHDMVQRKELVERILAPDAPMVISLHLQRNWWMARAASFIVVAAGKSTKCQPKSDQTKWARVRWRFVRIGVRDLWKTVPVRAEVCSRRAVHWNSRFATQ